MAYTSIKEETNTVSTISLKKNYGEATNERFRIMRFQALSLVHASLTH